jgi:hypothetical protein
LLLEGNTDIKKLRLRFGGMGDRFDSIVPLAKWQMKQRVLWDTTENSDESK